MNDATPFDDPRPEEAQRLVKARKQRGFADAKSAATYFGWNYFTYSQHERGERGIRKPVAERYAKALRVSLAWLTTGEGSPRDTTIPIVGYVGAGAVHVPFDQTEIDRVEAPEWANENTVAAVIRGDSLGSLFDQWLVYYDDVHESPTAKMLGKLCVIGLEDGRVMVKKITRSQQVKGLYTLLSNFDPPIYDIAVRWCAIVKTMSPR